MTASDRGVAAVLDITFGQPERRNALDRATLAAVADRIRQAGDDTRVVVLRSQGPTFSAGADLREIRGDLRDLETDDHLHLVRTAIGRCPVPVIVAVQGGCYGAAVDLVGACDLVVAGADARFALPAASLGILYDPRAIENLADRLRPGFLNRLFLAGDPIDVDDALAGGLADLCTQEPPAQEAMRIANSIADMPTAAVRATLDALRMARRRTLVPGDFDRVRRSLLSSPERAEAVRRAQHRLGIAPPDGHTPRT